MRQLPAGVDVDQSPGQHPQLTDPVKGPGANRCQAHQQVDDEKGKNRNQSQGEQVKATLAGHTGVDHPQLVAETGLHRVAQQEARDEKRQGRTKGRGEGNNDRSRHQAKERSSHQGHDRRAGQGQSGDRDVEQKEHSSGRNRLRGAIGFKRRLLALDIVQVEKAPQIEGEERADQQDQHHQQKLFANIHMRVSTGQSVLSRGGSAMLWDEHAPVVCGSVSM